VFSVLFLCCAVLLYLFWCVVASLCSGAVVPCVVVLSCSCVPVNRLVLLLLCCCVPVLLMVRRREWRRAKQEQIECAKANAFTPVCACVFGCTFFVSVPVHS